MDLKSKIKKKKGKEEIKEYEGESFLLKRKTTEKDYDLKIVPKA